MAAASPTQPDHSSIGICFSGGGFRASFYALGVLRYLAEARLLDRVTAICAVSGGSIATAAVADRWTEFQRAGGSVEAFLEKIDRPFRSRITSKNLRRRWLLGSAAAALPLTGGRGGAYARTLAHNLYDHKRIAELPTRPHFIFTATDLSKGRPFWIAPAFIGAYDYDYIRPTPSSIRTAAAVAASAAFPPSLTVVNLKTRGLPFPKQAPKKLSLVDGGVYDNLGLEWFQGWDEDAVRPPEAGPHRPAFTIVANASGLLTVKDKRFWALTSLPRDLAVQYQQSLNLRVRWYYESLTQNRGSGVYIAIKSDARQDRWLPPAATEGAIPSELVAPLARLRTDLDRFAPEEADLLSYHAYWTLHARLVENAPALALSNPSWRQYANPPADERARLHEILDLGAHRFFRRIRRLLPDG
jgi:NTE family protein